MATLTITIPESIPDFPAADVVEGAAMALGWAEGDPVTAEEQVAGHLEREIWNRYKQHRHSMVEQQVQRDVSEPIRGTGRLGNGKVVEE